MLTGYRILLVDDDILDSDCIERGSNDEFEENYPIGGMGYYLLALREQGFEVLTATDPAEALEQVISEGSRLDLVVLDIMMPPGPPGSVFSADATSHGMTSGFELARAIRDLRPSLRIVFLSGIAPLQEDAGIGSKGYFSKLKNEGVVVEYYSKELTPMQFCGELRRILSASD